MINSVVFRVLRAPHAVLAQLIQCGVIANMTNIGHVFTWQQPHVHFAVRSQGSTAPSSRDTAPSTLHHHSASSCWTRYGPPGTLMPLGFRPSRILFPDILPTVTSSCRLRARPCRAPSRRYLWLSYTLRQQIFPGRSCYQRCQQWGT